MSESFLTPSVLAVLSPVLIAVLLLGKDWVTNRNLRLTLENIDLNADIAARKAEIVAEELAASQKAQREQALTLAAQVQILGQVAQDTADTKVIQAATGAKVDGQMTALNEQIAELSNALATERQAAVYEKERAATLAVQTEKDRGEASARLAAAQVAGTNLEQAEKMDPNGDLSVTIPETTLPVEPTKPPSLIITPPGTLP